MTKIIFEKLKEMALQSSGPISWSSFNMAFGNTSNSQLSMSTLRSSTQGVGTSNISCSNWQNACIPLNGWCLNRFLSNVNVALNDATSTNTAFNNSNGRVTYCNNLSVPNFDYFANEWSGFFRIQADGTHTFQLALDDGGNLLVNNSVVASHYGAHGAFPAGTASTVSLSGGVYPFKLRHAETFGGQDVFVAYTPPGGTTTTPSSTTNNDFISRLCYLYKPIIKFDANDLAYRQGLSATSQISTWSNNGTDSTLRHATGASGNSTTTPTLTSDANGFMVSFNRTNQQHFTIGNLEFDQFRSTDASPINKNGVTIFIVGRMPTTNAGLYERFFDFGTAQATNNIMVFRQTTVNSIGVCVFTSTTNNGEVVFGNGIDGGFHVYTIIIQNGTSVTISLHIDNQAITYGITNTVTPNANIGNRITTLNYIGRSNWASDSYLTGDIRELMVFREVIDNTTLSRMNQYLMYKWGIQAFMPPVTSGMVGLYTGESWTGTQWSDVSGSGNHVTTVGGTVTTSTLNGLTSLTGTTTTSMTWPTAILPSTYTLFHVTRYNGSNFQRIFQGSGANWLSGFWQGRSGVAHHNGWITQIINVHGTNWVLSTDQNALYRSNGTDRTNGSPGNPSNARLCINAGDFAGEASEWACGCVIVYNRTLTTNEIVQVETFLNRRYNVF